MAPPREVIDLGVGHRRYCDAFFGAEDDSEFAATGAVGDFRGLEYVEDVDAVLGVTERQAAEVAYVHVAADKGDAYAIPRAEEVAADFPGPEYLAAIVIDVDITAQLEDEDAVFAAPDETAWPTRTGGVVDLNRDAVRARSARYDENALFAAANNPPVDVRNS